MSSPEYQGNVSGKIKCSYCGLYYDDNLPSHGCNAEKRETEQDTDSTQEAE